MHNPVPNSTIISIAFVITIAIILRWLAHWRFIHLKWPYLTPLLCRRYLLSQGWTEPWFDDQVPRLSKGDLHIIVTCIASDPATKGAVTAAIDIDTQDNRHFVVFTPGYVSPAVVADMLWRKVSVICYKEIGELDRILAEHAAISKKHRDSELRIRTSSLDRPALAELMNINTSWLDQSQTPKTGSLVAETEHIECYFRGGKTETLLVWFNDSWHFGASGRLQLGTDFRQLGCSVIDFVSKEPNWFPEADMSALLQLFTKEVLAQFKRRITLGFSQGGYGALKFSNALSATVTIAFSPQFTIDARVLESYRFADFFKSSLNVGMGLQPQDCKCPAFAFLDTYDSHDLIHAQRISEVLSINIIRLPFLGHGTAQIIDDQARLLQVIAACQANDTFALMRLGAIARRQYLTRSYLVAQQLASAKPSQAIRIMKKYGKNWSDNDQAALCYKLAVSGAAYEAFQWMNILSARNQNEAGLQGCAALVALEARELGAANTYIAKARELDPKNEKWAHFQLRIREAQFD